MSYELNRHSILVKRCNLKILKSTGLIQQSLNQTSSKTAESSTSNLNCTQVQSFFLPLASYLGSFPAFLITFSNPDSTTPPEGHFCNTETTFSLFTPKIKLLMQFISLLLTSRSRYWTLKELVWHLGHVHTQYSPAVRFSTTTMRGWKKKVEPNCCCRIIWQDVVLVCQIHAALLPHSVNRYHRVSRVIKSCLTVMHGLLNEPKDSVGVSAKCQTKIHKMRVKRGQSSQEESKKTV